MVKGWTAVHSSVANMYRRWLRMVQNGWRKKRNKPTEDNFKTLSAKHLCAYFMVLDFVAVCVSDFVSQTLQNILAFTLLIDIVMWAKDFTLVPSFTCTHPIRKFLLSFLLHIRSWLGVHCFLALYLSGSDHISQIVLRYFRNYCIRMPPVLKPLFLHFPQLYIGRSKKQKLFPA